MKQLLLILSAIFIITTANAQVGKGHKYLGGSLNVNFDENGYSNTVAFPTGTTYYSNHDILNLQVIPEVGWFLSDKWSVGVRPSYSRVSGTETSYYYDVDPAKNNTTINKYHTDVIGLGVNLRYYWMLTDKVALVPQFGISTANNLQSFGDGTLVAGVNPYLMFFPTEKLGINFGFGNLAYYFDYKTRGSSVNLGVNNNFSFGLNYYW